MSHVILPKQNKQGMDIITKESLCRLLGINPSRIKESSTDSDFIKKLKQRTSFDFTTKTKDTPPAPVEDTLIAAFRDASTKASFGLLDGFVQANQRWHNGGKN